MDKYICIHGHFYQPPRENPWLDEVESQESAYPYHDWNEKISSECYAANASSLILDAGRKIIDAVSVYESISFDFGPTLLSWLERHKPDVYRAILEADKNSGKLFSGHGSAMAQPYSHMIMPLASTRDKRTQVIWGIKDFEYRFRRKPEGMWLPETAVDLETLDIMAEHGIRFTILGPHQAAATREIGAKIWEEISRGKIDAGMPYICRLPSGRAISVFFYNHPISIEVSFANLLNDGVVFANRLAGAFTPTDDESQIVSIATDGETYGHHRRFGDMALAFCIRYLETKGLARITNFANYLDIFPPTHEVRILENSSWSCSHGVERWRADCGCSFEKKPGWNQAWRSPLREGMDWLRDSLEHVYEKHMKPYTGDPWGARDKYISVVLERTQDAVNSFLSQITAKKLGREDRVTILKLLEMQRYAMYIYTSCEWYFDDISGIEALQGLRYAARAIQLAHDVDGQSLEHGFVKFLERAKSNKPDIQNAAVIYDTVVRPCIGDLVRVGAHYAVSSIFKEYDKDQELYGYTVKREVGDQIESGAGKLLMGSVSIRSNITEEQSRISYAVLYLGGFSLISGAQSDMEKTLFAAMHKEVKNSFLSCNFHQTASYIKKYFGKNLYSLHHLFKDKQAEIIGRIMHSSSKELKKTIQGMYKHQDSAIEPSSILKVPALKYYHRGLEFAVNRDIAKAIGGLREDDYRRLAGLLEDASTLAIEIDRDTISYAASAKLVSILSLWHEKPEDASSLQNAVTFLKALRGLSLNLILREPQNIYFHAGKKLLNAMISKAGSGDKKAQGWVNLYRELGDYINAQVDERAFDTGE